jgi:hypothetical protein
LLTTGKWACRQAKQQRGSHTNPIPRWALLRSSSAMIGIASFKLTELGVPRLCRQRSGVSHDSINGQALAAKRLREASARTCCK